MDQIQSFEIDAESFTRLIHELRTENSQIAADFKKETEQCHIESEECSEDYDQCTTKYDQLKNLNHIAAEEWIEEKEKWTEERNSLKNDLQECSSNRYDSLQPTGRVGISVIRQVENARETDTCIGTETNSGYITSSSCCKVDQMFLFEFENSTEIEINLENSF